MAQNQGKEVLSNLSTFPTQQRKMYAITSFVQEGELHRHGMLFIVVSNGSRQKEVSELYHCRSAPAQYLPRIITLEIF